MTLTRQPVTAAIHPELLAKLMINLHPIPFDRNSTLYDLGWRACQENFAFLLNYHLNPVTTIKGDL